MKYESSHQKNEAIRPHMKKITQNKGQRTYLQNFKNGMQALYWILSDSEFLFCSERSLISFLIFTTFLIKNAVFQIRNPAFSQQWIQRQTLRLVGFHHYVQRSLKSFFEQSLSSFSLIMTPPPQLQQLSLALNSAVSLLPQLGFGVNSWSSFNVALQKSELHKSSLSSQANLHLAPVGASMILQGTRQVANPAAIIEERKKQILILRAKPYLVLLLYSKFLVSTN